MAKRTLRTFAKPENQVRRLMQRDQSKARDDPTKLSSIGTRRNYEDRLVQFGRWLKEEKRGTAIVDATADDVQSWLQAERERGLSQKTLDMDRHAGNFLLHETGKLEADGKLAKVQAVAQTVKEPRAYTQEEVDAIVARMEDRNALGAEICFTAGLRAHELLTLQRLTPESRQPDVRYYDKEKTQPKNSPLKFTDTKGQSHGVAYTVEGKGGLIREVRIPEALAERLESYRLETPKSVVDRKIHFKDVRYDIGAGQNLSRAFSKMSHAVLGDTGRTNHGIHGLRHSYAQDRLDTLIRNPDIRDYQKALEIVSQELGHWRPSVTLEYLNRK